MAENQKKNYRGGKAQAEARREARRAARESVMALLFEYEYHDGEAPEVIYDRAVEARELNGTPAVRRTFLAIVEHLPLLDALIQRHASGWRTDRLSRVSRAILRLGAYELVLDESIPAPVAINEAVELTKRFDDPKARAFVNGVLNAMKDELAANGGRLPDEVLAAAKASAPVETTEEPSAEAPVAMDTADTADETHD